MVDVPERVIQNGHAAFWPFSSTFMTAKVASVKPPIV